LPRAHVPCLCVRLSAWFALRETQLKNEHKTTWWPAHRVSAHNEKTWLDSLELRISDLDERGGVSLYMLFDPHSSLVAVSWSVGVRALGRRWLVSPQSSLLQIYDLPSKLVECYVWQVPDKAGAAWRPFDYA
jgi:hypothetical protein